ncbi:hypothetical protein LTR37_019049 [Vermiconidia calcicola]|uniref:Uncharacterized protein n=1 Tax=Vermiconidia calcicola TaxID=1690605 RepID=A0ACC3MH25_9PEZI|nr:hypothetical protein LTR37_019049 [Vermiconidia calcicola]
MVTLHQGSKKLQQKLFSIPATLEEAKTLGMMAEESYVLVYNEGDAYNIFSADNELMGVLSTHILAYQGVNQVYDNSSVFKLTGTILKDTTSGRHKRASWERMYLSQPPMSPAYFHVSSGDQGPYFIPDEEYEISFEDVKPKTAPEIMDAAQHYLAKTSGNAVPCCELRFEMEGWQHVYRGWEAMFDMPGDKEAMFEEDAYHDFLI